MKAETNRMLLKLDRLACESHTHDEIVSLYKYFYNNNLINLLEYKHRMVVYAMIDRGILKKEN
jgi:hypothetical protein